MALYIVGTPIGNLKDITLRALETLRQVDLVVAEDTRVIQKLLSHYEIKKKLISFHEHSTRGTLHSIVSALREGKSVAYVVDAGTPGISDPGAFLVREIVRVAPRIPIVPIPGPSALTAAISVAGLAKDRFLFLGFPPRKKGRRAFFSIIKESKYPVVIYESPHRLKKTLEDLCSIGLSTFDAVLIKEISKVYEMVTRMNMVEMSATISKEKKLRGEFVLVINK